MKVFPHGQGGGDGPTHYLVRPDYPGRDEQPPEVLRGDVETTRDLIDSLDTKWKFTAGVLSWHPDDAVTPEQERRVMDDFEEMAFAGLESDQRNILWVRHSHAGHHELHFVIPRVELSSGKAFNPCPPGWQKNFDVFRDMHNHREGWARPDDPARARLHTPEHADLHNARLLRWGKTPSKDDRAAAKEAIHSYMQANIEQGLVRSREDVLQALAGAGLEINRTGKDYITVKDPESGEKLRLKGGIYAEHWKLELADREIEGQNRAGTAGDGNFDPTTVRHLESEFARIVEKRAQYNRGRYPAPAHQLGAERDFTLPDSERRLWLEMPASPGHHPVHPDERDIQRLGLANAGREENHGLAPGNNHAVGTERIPGSAERPDMGHIQGVGTISLGGQELSADAGRLDNHPQRNGRETRRLENSEEISHDRTGTHAQKHIAHPGAGFDRHAENPRHIPGQSATQPGEPRSGHPPATGENRATPGRTGRISTALATLERYTRELGTALVAFERLVERQIERLREQERQRSRGPGMGR
ncbi:relaxase/mobilization nuclease domain-containing protein [Desulfococcaceae bacterium OttesenSCG-928-F15]|nr:relaxase/mobilization nuclease domain-containing protein [Desulfococcaceae bacterium OttesenSCG-928-F15]